jgi:hypothetical protein
VNLLSAEGYSLSRGRNKSATQRDDRPTGWTHEVIEAKAERNGKTLRDEINERVVRDGRHANRSPPKPRRRRADDLGGGGGGDFDEVRNDVAQKDGRSLFTTERNHPVRL